MMLIDYIKQWAKENAGLLLSAHQSQRIIDQLNAYFINKNLTENEFINALKLKNKQVEIDFLDILTVQESYFYRDQSLFQFLESIYLPELIKQKTLRNDLEINIWSAGCSYGEEIYSIVILINQLIKDLAPWKLTFYATDINFQALEMAKKGLYSKAGLRASDQVFIEKYFHQRQKQYHLKDEIKQQVKFDFFNLSNSPLPNIKFDLIFCRNVFIYLTLPTINRALDIFNQALKQQGILFIGPSDLISHQTHNFKTCSKHGTTMLIKKNTDAPIQPIEKLTKENLISYADKQNQKGQIIRSIKEKMAQKNYTAVLKEIDAINPSEEQSALLLRNKGEALLHLGDVETAKTWLNKSILLNRLDPKSYFLLALADINDPDKSEQLLKKVLFLDNDFFEAHYHLALLLLRKKQVEKGLNHLLKSKKIAELRACDQLLFFSNETTGNFLISLSAEINHYQGSYNGNR